MAYSVIQLPGSVHGPCLSCNHRDCRQMKATADIVCKICDHDIGYKQEFTEDKDLGVVHFWCLAGQVEKERSLASVG